MGNEHSDNSNPADGPLNIQEKVHDVHLCEISSQKVVAAGRPKTTAAADQDGCCGRLTGDTAHDHNRVEGDHQQEG